MHLFLIILNFFFVTFTDKNESSKLSIGEQAILQREKWNIPIDSMDYSVSEDYITSLTQMGALICHTSRWMNGATIQVTSDSLIQHIQQLPFVKHIQPTGHTAPLSHNHHRKKQFLSLDTTYGEMRAQIEQINLTSLHQLGYHGQGISIAIIDGGFANIPYLTSFNATRNQILGTFSIYEDPTGIYGQEGSHGTACFSAIAAVKQNYIGAATSSYYYLIQSEEMATEMPKEADNLVRSLEIADSLGVNIASISLGYAKFDDTTWNYQYSQLDGQSLRASKAALIAARKGMLVVVAAGNEGNNDWKYISSPADADSIITVGAVDLQANIAPFSSIGPTADGRIKPDVCATGRNTHLISSNTDSIYLSSGTSFACPIIAGMAACLWSALPNENAMQIRQRIIQSSHLYATPNNVYGHGIPNAWNAYTGQTDIFQPTQNTIQYKTITNRTILIHRNGQTYDILGNIVQ